MKAELIEIFMSLQGEGPYLGQMMSFVRLQHCAFSCRFCDTPASFEKFSEFRLETPPGSGQFISRPSPISSSELSEILADYGCPLISVTGGEPLQQGDFLREWLPQCRAARPDFRFLLETAGILWRELEKTIACLDIVSMDLKLPSVSGMRPFWEEHRRFLEIARKKETYLKVVVDAQTLEGELKTAIELVAETAPECLFILQPVTPRPGCAPARPEQLVHWYQLAASRLPQVRVIAQMHPQLALL